MYAPFAAMEESLTSPTYPPADASRAVLAFLRDELPLGGTAAEARFLRFFPLLVSRIVGELNGQHVKLVKLKGEFVWHRHEQADELFLVIRGPGTCCPGAKWAI